MDITHEPDIRHEILTDASYFNANFDLKPQSYQALYCELVEKHLELFDLGTNKTITNGITWVIISLTIEVVKPLKKTGKIYARTWKSGLRGPYFMRDFVFENEDGDVYFQGTSFSVLLNLETRHVCRDKKLPYFSLGSYDLHVTKGFPTWKNAYGDDFAPATSDQSFRVERKVENSYIDMLGHVNNMRYGEFIYDTLDSGQIRDLVNLSRMEIYFGSELKAEDTFTVSKASADRTVYVCGENTKTGEASFHAALRFENE